jgi:hypothetical protein
MMACKITLHGDVCQDIYAYVDPDRTCHNFVQLEDRFLKHIQLLLLRRVNASSSTSTAPSRISIAVERGMFITVSFDCVRAVEADHTSTLLFCGKTQFTFMEIRHDSSVDEINERMNYPHLSPQHNRRSTTPVATKPVPLNKYVTHWH